MAFDVFEQRQPILSTQNTPPETIKAMNLKDRKRHTKIHININNLEVNS